MDALLEAVTLNELVLLLLAVTVLKLSRSFNAVSLVFSSDIMNITADKPLTLVSFFAILALINVFCGKPSASVRLCASVATFTPEPAPSDVMIACAFALFVAARSAAAVEALVPLVEVTEVVAMIFFKLSTGIRLCLRKLETIYIPR